MECATDPLEAWLAACFSAKSLPGLPISMTNPLSINKLIFRCFVVPTLCEMFVQAATKAPKKMSLYLNQFSSRVRAFERLDSDLKARDAQVREGKTNARASGPPNWLNCTPEVAIQRLETFDAWREAALRSFWYFHRQFYEDTGFADPKEQLAAWAGYVQSKTPLSNNLLAFLMHQEELSSPNSLTVFVRNLKKGQASKFGSAYLRWKSKPERDAPPTLMIDCWLIEIWPLVLDEEWGYGSLVKLAEVKFNGFENPPDYTTIQRRCGDLKLELAKCRRPGGPEPSCTRVKFPLSPTARLAVAIQAITEDSEKWLHGSPRPLP